MTDSIGVSGTQPANNQGDAASPETAAHRAARQWVNHLARTLKTCRLYEQSTNTTVERFFEDLTTSLAQFHDEFGPLTLRFTSDDVRHEDASLYLARSREDNLALPFYRDGIRSLTFNAGITKDQVEAVIAAILRVTSPVPTDDDLVTLLWESHLDHVDLDYVPAEGDVGVGQEVDDDEPMPWPDPQPESTAEVITVEEDNSTDAPRARSDDWVMRELTTEVEAGFAELESLSAAETRRFHAEYQAEHLVPATTAAIAVVQAYLAAGGDALDTKDLGRFLPRVLRDSLGSGNWIECAEAVSLLARFGGELWSQQTFVQELLQPISIASLSATVDGQDTEGVLDFIQFARALGDTEIDLLLGLLAQSESRRNRRMLSEVVVQRCRENPERLAPWLADPRWFVVRNVVHMLGAIGGPPVTGLLESVARHAEPRVRYAVVASLSRVPPAMARPLLLTMLEGADTRTFCSALQVLAGARDSELARRMFDMMQQPEFERRPVPERRAIYQTIATSADDDIVPDLEADLHRGGWFSSTRDDHRVAVARCLARIGTVHSMQALERGAQSRRAGVRRVCEEALLGWAPHE